MRADHSHDEAPGHHKHPGAQQAARHSLRANRSKLCATLATLASATVALTLAISTRAAAAAFTTAANATPPARYADATSTTPSAVQAHPAVDPTPLPTYASTHHYPPVLQPTTQATLQKQIARITFDLSKDPPPTDNCAQTLGAKRFATLYDDLAQAYSNMAEHVEAVEAYAKAINCNPRADFLHAELAASLLDLGRFTDARMEAQRQLHLGRANFTLYTLLTQLDFIDEHWADAIANARIAATMAPNDEQATYWQCFLWLAQLRSGSQEPILAKRRIAENWPAPILESLQGKITESELVEAVGEERDQNRQRDILSEALFYTGQQKLAAGQKDEAVKYFTATVNLKVVYFIEHQLATAELRKLTSPADQKSNSPLM